MSIVQVKVRQQPCNWQVVRHLLPAEFSHAAVRNYMKCNNYFVFSIGITALCHFAFFTQIVPCNVRLKFNKLTGDTVTFDAPGGP